jgi:hypothetical protein
LIRRRANQRRCLEEAGWPTPLRVDALVLGVSSTTFIDRAKVRDTYSKLRVSSTSVHLSSSLLSTTIAAALLSSADPFLRDFV